MNFFEQVFNKNMSGEGVPSPDILLLKSWKSVHLLTQLLWNTISLLNCPSCFFLVACISPFIRLVKQKRILTEIADRQIFTVSSFDALSLSWATSHHHQCYLLIISHTSSESVCQVIWVWNSAIQSLSTLIYRFLPVLVAEVELELTLGYMYNVGISTAEG